jgi:hypothetical protein
MIGAKEAKIFRPVISCVSVDMVDVNWDSAGMRVAFVPSAHAALLTIGRYEVGLDVPGGFVKTGGRTVNFAREPSPNVFSMMKGRATLVRTIDERISADNIVAAVPFTRDDFSY